MKSMGGKQIWKYIIFEGDYNFQDGDDGAGSKSRSAYLGIYRWLSARLRYLQCISNGDTAVFHKAIDMN